MVRSRPLPTRMLTRARLAAAGLRSCEPIRCGAVRPFTRTKQLVSCAFSSCSTTSSPTQPSSQEVIAAAERFMNDGGGYFNPLNESLLADDFVFRGPVIGPFCKRDYIEVLEHFRMYKAFDDFSPNTFGFTVDPEDQLRVWFFVRARGVNAAPIGGMLGRLGAFASPPERRTEYRGSPEAWSLTFNSELQVRAVTAGYVVDRFDRQATTGGRGLSFGALATLGIPLPVAPGSWALIAVQWVTSCFVWTGLLPKAASARKDVPAWWTDRGGGHGDCCR